MLTLETVNELTLRVTCKGGDILYTKAGAFIAGDNMGQKNYTFEKVPAIIWDRKTILLRKYFSDLSRDLLRQLSAPSCGARQEKIFRS